MTRISAQFHKETTMTLCLCLQRFACILLLSLAALLIRTPVAHAQLAPIGVAKVDITPKTPVRLYGYASRKNESTGVAGPLHAAALAIGDDAAPGPAVLLTIDNGSLPRPLRDELLRRLQARAGLKPDRLMLCHAHIHSGPDIHGMDSMTGEQREHLAQYARQLTDQIEQVVLQALASRRPARLEWTQGSVSFAANRRVLKNGKWSGFGANPAGPVDHTLPLLRVTDADGKLLALLVNYACHNTTLRDDFTQIHADWAGTAQEYLEADHPGAIALVTLGCGADSDPNPHGTVALCRQHGRALADEVNRLLTGPFKLISPTITSRQLTLDIPFDAPPPVDQLKRTADQSYAVSQVLQHLEQGQKPPKSAPYFLATWSFGNDLAMAFLSNEVTVDYALRLKRELDPQRLWINAYTNDVSMYIPSQRLIQEGGYEVNNSLAAFVTYGHPDRLHPTLEDRIIASVRSLLPDAFHSK